MGNQLSEWFDVQVILVGTEALCEAARLKSVNKLHLVLKTESCICQSFCR